MATFDNIPPDLGRILADLTARVKLLEARQTAGGYVDSGVETTSITGITSTTYTTTGAVCELTFQAPPSGSALMIVYAWPSIAATTGEIYVSYEIRNDTSSGSVVQAAADTNGVSSVNVDRLGVSAVSLATGLTPGNDYYARILHRVSASTGAIRYRRLMAVYV